MCFDIGKMTVPIESRSVPLGTCQVAQYLFSFTPPVSGKFVLVAQKLIVIMVQFIA